MGHRHMQLHLYTNIIHFNLILDEVDEDSRFPYSVPWYMTAPKQNQILGTEYLGKYDSLITLELLLHG